MKKLEDIKITVIGDVMIDRYILGKVERISPEAPVPIVEYEKEDISLGGAANVAENLSKMGCFVNLVGCCGTDRFALILKDLIRLDSINIHPYIIEDHNRLTTIKTRIIGNNKQITRIDIEDRKEFNFLKFNLNKKEIDSIIDCDCVIISDYGKGFITEKLLNFIDKIKKENTKILIDPHIRNIDHYKKSFLIKPNKKEYEQIKKFIPSLEFKYLLRTEGSNGSTLLSRDLNNELIELNHFEVPKVDVVDITGAGDVTISTLSILLSMGYNIDDSCKISNIIAGISVTKDGTNPISKKEFLENLKKEGNY